jgi:hypothetical protein
MPKTFTNFKAGNVSVMFVLVIAHDFKKLKRYLFFSFSFWSLLVDVILS